ncbi:RAG1-activating protein 1 like protein [Trachymyrmex septentrionalis]|uniref:Sugar transporter SWEET n=1 Tax=Trachymyrmex septentrionalis TaxID=34720 RepID=A0A151JYD9_9HYME|nr:PREDICTED: sugar transporter SWEET1 isoform X1 [Trachymyrmex septentrionalis]KYN40929.1 RAG1-activating protein 1 like protein [Trachymyrmex septentrionalis]
MALEDYKEVVGFCAMYTTMAQMLSGTFICRNIHKKGSARGVDPMPFLGTIGLCILMLRYAWMLGDSIMINVNIFGLLTNMIYMIIYYYYAPNTKEVLKLIYKVTIFVVIFLVYAQMEHPANIEFRFGIVVTVLLLLLIAAPLAHLKNVIKTKNTEILPFPLIFMGTLVSFQWLLYGLIIDNVFIIFQNAIGFILSIAQLSLFVIFPSKKSEVELSNDHRKEN